MFFTFFLKLRFGQKFGYLLILAWFGELQGVVYLRSEVFVVAHISEGCVSCTMSRDYLQQGCSQINIAKGNFDNKPFRQHILLAYR